MSEFVNVAKIAKLLPSNFVEGSVELQKTYITNKYDITSNAVKRIIWKVLQL